MSSVSETGIPLSYFGSPTGMFMVETDTNMINLINDKIRISRLILDIQFCYYFIYNKFLEDYEMEILFGSEGAD